MPDRIAALQALLQRDPDDPRAHFGLAAELEKQQQWEAMILHLRRYLELTEDEGNAWGRLARALAALGRTDEAAAAYRDGITAAQRHGHPSMASEFEEALSTLEV